MADCFFNDAKNEDYSKFNVVTNILHDNTLSHQALGILSCRLYIVQFELALTIGGGGCLQD
jgi:hypothetical protein